MNPENVPGGVSEDQIVMGLMEVNRVVRLLKSGNT